ncbi:MAG TPA: DUF4390 domain-containing protein [Spirochaetota bacterium]|nr:DUF4390 domain-containing protein [Spirochaetota bacterium]
MKRKTATIVTVILLVLLGAGGACAENLTIQFQRNTVSDGQINVFFSLQGSISYDTVDAIRNGITAKLKINFQLTRSEGFLSRGQDILREKVEELTISYDVWENGFVIENEEPRSVQQVKRASNIVSKVNEMISPTVIDAASLSTDEEVSLRAKIYIQTIKLYPPFGIFLYFFDPWNYESDWIYSSPFTLKK